MLDGVQGTGEKLGRFPGIIISRVFIADFTFCVNVRVCRSALSSRLNLLS
jgi:hypothetical protein